MDQQGILQDGSKPLVTRRTVALGAAWSVPVIMVAAAAPAAAASVHPAGAVSTGVSSMVKGSGQNYTLTMAFALTGKTGDKATITITSVTTSTQSGTVTFSTVPQTKTLTIGGQTSAIFALVRNGNNSGPTVTVTYTVNGGSPMTATVAVS
jgi:hypothetical protein